MVPLRSPSLRLRCGLTLDYLWASPEWTVEVHENRTVSPTSGRISSLSPEVQTVPMYLSQFFPFGSIFSSWILEVLLFRGCQKIESAVNAEAVEPIPDCEGPMPTESQPSDHHLLAADFRLTR